jgi:beta-glucosidase/6-phospho-beta-glucosidase/beta-galactosidase
MSPAGLLGSWFVAGFEGSTHRRSDGRRLDLVEATAHDRFAAEDYARMRRMGITAARESLRWHLVEGRRGRYDFGVELPRIEAAVAADITVVWDLCHFGWPDHVDPFAPEFPDRFGEWAREVAAVMRREVPAPHWFAPQNEISFLAWAGGDVAAMNPHARRRGPELKRQLVAGAVRAIDAIRSELPDARFLHPEPLINVAADPERPHERHHAARATEAQYEAWEMLAGRVAPELGGSERHLDVLGVNYYPDNQWTIGGGALAPDSADRVELSEMLAEVHRRFGRPILISETGTEDEGRGPWLSEVTREVDAAIVAGVPVEGICLYPVLNHPGWEDERHCRNGLWDYPGPRGGRQVHRPLRRVLSAYES